MLKLVRASVLYSLLVCIPFGGIDTMARSELYSLGSKIHSHTDRDVLHDQDTVLLPALQSKDDIALDIHNSRVYSLHTQRYTQIRISQGRSYDTTL